MGKSSLIQQMRACAVAAKNFAGGLIADLASTTSDAIEEMDTAKQDKPMAVSCTIQTSGWGSDSTEGYPNYYDITASGVTTKDRAEVTLAPSGLDTAVKCGMCQTCETLAGKIRLRAVSIPSADIAAQYWIEQGKG